MSYYWPALLASGILVITAYLNAWHMRTYMILSFVAIVAGSVVLLTTPSGLHANYDHRQEMRGSWMGRNGARVSAVLYGVGTTALICAAGFRRHPRDESDESYA